MFLSGIMNCSNQHHQWHTWFSLLWMCRFKRLKGRFQQLIRHWKPSLGLEKNDFIIQTHHTLLALKKCSIAIPSKKNIIFCVPAIWMVANFDLNTSGIFIAKPHRIAHCVPRNMRLPLKWQLVPKIRWTVPEIMVAWFIEGHTGWNIAMQNR